MNTTTILDNLQKIIENAEILASFVPEEAMDDMWMHETIDNALGELERTGAYLRDKYDIEMFMDNDISEDEFSESFLDEADDDFANEVGGFEFDLFTDDNDDN